MRMLLNRNTPSYKSPEVPLLPIGIDKHKDNCCITTVNDQGTILREARVKNTVADGADQASGTAAQ